MKKGDSSSKVFFKGFLGVLCEGGVHLGEVQINGLENYEMGTSQTKKKTVLLMIIDRVIGK